MVSKGGKTMLKSGTIVKHENQLGKIIKDKDRLLFAPVGQYVRSYEDLKEVTEENAKEVNSIERIEYMKKDFSWGEVTKVHTVGEYIIFEFISGYELKEEGKTVIMFHAYINYQNIGVSYHSLDSCIVGTIAYKYDGANSQAGKFFERMVEMV